MSSEAPVSRSVLPTSIDASSVESLCQSCQRIDWPNIPSLESHDLIRLGTPSSYGPSGAIVLRYFPSSRAQLLTSSCRVCHLVGNLRDQSSYFNTCRLEICEARNYKRFWKGETTGIVKLAVRSMHAPSPLSTRGANDDVVRYLRAHSYSESSTCGVQKIKPFSIAFDSFRDAIRICSDLHGSCRSTNEWASRLRLIDVETGQISEAKIGCKYVALSYVWGKESSSPKNTNDFPSVVSDAISVTRDLGCRYLWVDRYCINQESEHKQHMINQMDRVYSHAFITIIAAAGNDPSYGSPGISRPRPVQGRATVGGTHLIELWDDGLDIVKNSTWASRGWTYQEGYLSTRCLLFIDREVICLCNERHMTETQAYYLGLDDMSEIMKRFHWMIPPYYKSDSWTFHYSLGPHIEEYSARNLSYDGDGLNAFLGILNHYESLATDLHEVVSHFWGIPILLKLGINGVLFDLLWRHRKVAATRRLDFSSWSWVGWTSAIQFAWKPMYFAMTTPSSRRLMDSTFGAIDESQSSIENTAWSISISSHGKICELPDFFCRGDQRFSNQKELWITALVLKMRFREVDAKICATFLVRDDIFVAIPVLFDTPFDADIHTLGLLLPRDGGRHRYTNRPIYSVIILQKVGENRFERAGILDLQCSDGILGLQSSGFHGRLSIHEKTILNAKDEILKEEVEPVDYLFLRGAEKRSFWFV